MKIYLFLILSVISFNFSFGQATVVKKFAKYYLDNVYGIEKKTFNLLDPSAQKTYYDDFISKIKSHDPHFHIPANGLHTVREEMSKRIYEMILKPSKNTIIYSSIENSQLSSRKKLLEYNQLLTKESNLERRKEIIKSIYKLRYSQLHNKELMMIRQNASAPIEVRKKYMGFGKFFDTHEERTTYIIKMQIALKEMNLYQEQIDGIYGVKTEQGLHKLMNFLEIPYDKNTAFEKIHSNINLDFSNSVVKTKTDIDQAKKVSKKLLNRELYVAQEICLNNEGVLSWDLSLQNISINIELPSLDVTINAKSESGRKYSYSTKKNNVDEKDNEFCRFESLCLSNNPVIVLCGDISIKGINSLNININGYDISVPLN